MPGICALEEILRAVRIGRMTALQKPPGGICGIVVGDYVRHLVARTLAQQLCPAVERHTSPFQFALPTKSGCERGPHRTSNDGFGPEHNVVVGGRDRGFRPHITRSNVAGALRGGRWQQCFAFRQAVLQLPFNVLLDRRCRRHS